MAAAHDIRIDLDTQAITLAELVGELRRRMAS
jgi:hypothetical protein